MRKQEEKVMNEVLDNFDFERVKKVMDALNWVWASCDGVPEIHDLRKQSRRLLKQSIKGAIKGEVYQVGTGGFKASCYDESLSLEFIVTEWYEEF